MVVFVEYNIPKQYFVKHKKAIQNELNNLSFQIAMMKFEKNMSYLEIAKQQGISVRNVRLILSNSCERIREVLN